MKKNLLLYGLVLCLLLAHYAHGGASKLVGTMYIAKFLYPEQLPDLHPEDVFKVWLEKYQHLPYIEGRNYLVSPFTLGISAAAALGASLFCDTILMLKDTHVFAYGKAQEVLTEENIAAMYGVQTCVTVEDGAKHVRLLRDG